MKHCISRITFYILDIDVELKIDINHHHSNPTIHLTAGAQSGSLLTQMKQQMTDIQKVIPSKNTTDYSFVSPFLKILCIRLYILSICKIKFLNSELSCINKTLYFVFITMYEIGK